MKKDLFEKARKELAELEEKGGDKKTIDRLRRFVNSFEKLKGAQAKQGKLPSWQRDEEELNVWGSMD